MPTEQLTDNLGNSHVVDPARSLGRGGAGLVCRFVTSSLATTHCAKLYERSLRSPQLQRKVRHMTLNPPKALSGPTYSLAWPTHSLFSAQGSFVGFAMPQAPMGAVQLYEVSTMKLSPRLPPKWHKFDRKANGALELRAKICANLAIAIHSVHETGQYCLGDLKPQNILLSADGHTCVVDLDSLQISSNGQVLFPSHLVTPEYSPPEARTHKSGDALPVEWDLFSLAVCVYEVLIGVHPYAATARAQGVAADTLQGKIAQHLFVHGPNAPLLSSVPPPHALFAKLPRSVQQLFQEAFAIPVRSVVRPSAERWYEVLSECIRRGEFGSARTSGAPGNQQVGNQGWRTAPTQTNQPANPQTTPAGGSMVGRRTRSLIGGLFMVAVAFYLGYRMNRNVPDRMTETVERPGALQQEHSPDSGATVNSQNSWSPQNGSEKTIMTVEPTIAAPGSSVNGRSTSTNEVLSSTPRVKPAVALKQRYYFKDSNGDGVGGQESVLVNPGAEPPPHYVETSGDLWDGERLKISFLQQPQFLLPRNCYGAQAQVVRVRVTSHGGRPVGNCTVTLGLATPLTWITEPRPKKGSSGAYEVVTGSDGSVSLHVSPPASRSDNGSVTLSFAVNGASPQMSATGKITLTVCPTCTPCHLQ